MTFNDIFKSSFLEKVSSISVFDMILTILLSFGVGLFIFLVYKKTYRGVMYSAGFGTTLIALTMITATVILAVTSNVVLSLGMVGALSIVRFRTAIKDPMDLLFLFWSIGVGIICGAGLYSVAIVGSLVVTVVLLVLSLTPVVRAPFLLVVNGEDEELEKAVLAAVEHHTRAYRVKSRNRSRGHMDLIVEVRVKEGGDLLREVAAIPSVEEASLLSHDGETTF